MMGAACLGVSVFGYAVAVRRWKTASEGLGKDHREAPRGEWMYDICMRIDPQRLIRAFEEKVASHLGRLRALGRLGGKPADIAIGMHLIRHWNKEPRRRPCALEEQGVTGLFERYVTVQCVGPGAQLTLGDSTCRRLRIRPTTCAGS